MRKWELIAGKWYREIVLEGHRWFIIELSYALGVETKKLRNAADRSDNGRYEQVTRDGVVGSIERTGQWAFI